MRNEDILDWLGEIYHYNCCKCPRSNLSRDEVAATESGYMCLKCWYEKGGDDD
jgi:predicted SprT family Zn-dependent metalloprotease